MYCETTISDDEASREVTDFFVFESTLMLLFVTCVAYASAFVSIKKHEASMQSV